jgi:hypothetical protein
MIFSSTDKKHNAVILQKIQTITNGVLSPITWTPSKLFDCIFYYTNQKHFIMDNTFRTAVDAIVLASPKDMKESDLLPECRLSIYKKKNYISGTANGAQSAGVTTLNCIFSDSLFPIKKGDILFIGTDYYCIISTTKNMAGNTTSFTFAPALKANVLDKAILNMYPNLGIFMNVYADDIEGLGEVTKMNISRTDL